MRLPVLLVVPVLALAACKDKPKFIPPPDAGPLCEGTQQLVNGECRFVCQRDGDCMAGERCNLFLGQCEPKPPPPDAGPPGGLCTRGAVRCSADKKSIESCTADPPVWTTSMTCPPPSGFCQNERCLVCQPGAAQCVTGAPTELSVCLDDGSATRTVTCSGTATCQANECRECAPNAYRCNPANTALQQCQKTGDETATWKWTNVGDNFDGACITGQCRVGGGNGFECVPPACFPGQIQCKDTATAQNCSAMGAWVDAPCGAGRECQAGVCVDECADAVAAKSYFGCDYWSTTLDNSMDRLFKGNTVSGQGSVNAPSDFAFVVANRSVNAAAVTITRFSGGTVQTVTTAMVPGRNDPATKGLRVINVPWQSIGASTNNVAESSSGLARFGYRLQSSKPITVYQFNPLVAIKTTNKACTGNTYSCSCDEYSDFDAFACLLGGSNPGRCSAGRCTYGTFSNDASLLLPAHILGTSHVAITPNHVRLYAPAAGDQRVYGSYITVVGTQDNTQVTVRVATPTRAGTGVTAMARNEQRVFTLNSYDVLQLTSANVDGADLECQGSGSNRICRIDSDLTGSVVTSDKPVAMFSGTSCGNVPWNRAYCDHLEEQIFPFNTWGTRFVANRSHPLRLNNGNFATAASSPPDYWKIVAACPLSQCPTGTLITFSTPPAAGDVLAPNRCLSGTLAANNCRLPGGGFMEFRSTQNFTVTSEPMRPIAVAQFYPGQGTVTGLPTDPAQGDPSLVLLPPVEQWRSSYTVLAAPGIRDNYIGLSIDSTAVQSVSVDGVVVSGFTNITGTNFQVKNHPITVGTHTVLVTPRAGATTFGAGITIYGYDAQVSYGYTGGLDLQTIVTGINPGG